MGVVPHFPLTEIETWDDMTLMAANVFCEAEGEPDEGKLAVAWVVRNRADLWSQPIHDVIMAPYQFSWLNEDYRRRAESRLAAATETEACWKAAASGLWRLAPDPSQGSTHYLNEELTKRIRKGSLPAWFSEAKVRCRIGRHTFLVP